jgi:hypothetical protein
MVKTKQAKKKEDEKYMAEMALKGPVRVPKVPHEPPRPKPSTKAKPKAIVRDGTRSASSMLDAAESVPLTATGRGALHLDAESDGDDESDEHSSPEREGNNITINNCTTLYNLYFLL